MKLALTFLITLLLCSHTFAGTLSGTVRAQGKAEANQDLASGKYSSRKFKFAERINYDDLRDFVVYIDQPVAGSKPPVEHKQVVTQKDATFNPHVLPVMAGTTIEWPNNDEIFHNVFSMSETKQFDLGLYKNSSKSVTFDKPGQIDVFCSIHAKMNCIILVLENPYFAVADDKGRYSITNIPPGTYKLKAWHERVPSLVKEITIPEKGEVKVDFTLGITNLPKY
jgi:plastocyanin